MGLYQETVKAYEVVLGDGSCVRATRDNEYSDLYHCLPWSHGTLGFLVGLELDIIPVKPYVHMQYIPIKVSLIHLMEVDKHITHFPVFPRVKKHIVTRSASFPELKT